MISIEDHYLQISRNLLLATGLWPYQQSRLARLQYILIFCAVIVSIIFHFLTFITTECTPELVVKVFSSAFIFVSIAIQYFAFWLNRKTIRHLLEKLQNICDTMKDKNEIAIIEKYGNMSNRSIFWLVFAVLCGEFILILVQSWPSILDFVLPQNESRPPVLLFPTIYLLNHQKYFYLILLNINAALCIGTLALVAVGTMQLSCQACICGMLTVARYRLKLALKTDMLQSVRPRTGIPISKGIIQAIDIHRNAIMFTEFLLSSFEITLGFLILVGVSCLSLNFFRFFQIMTTGFNFHEIFLPVASSLLLIVYMFIANYIGQEFTDHNSQIFITVYNVQWYKAPVSVQRLILFLLQKGTKDFTLNVGGFITLSLQCFASLINTSVSYFTMLYSTQK